MFRPCRVQGSRKVVGSGEVSRCLHAGWLARTVLAYLVALAFNMRGLCLDPCAGPFRQVISHARMLSVPHVWFARALACVQALSELKLNSTSMPLEQLVASALKLTDSPHAAVPKESKDGGPPPGEGAGGGRV